MLSQVLNPILSLPKQKNNKTLDIAITDSNSWDWPQTAHWSPNPVPFSTRPNFPPQVKISFVIIPNEIPVC